MKQFLKDIADISAGQGAPQGDSNYCEDGIPFVKAGNLLELTEGSSIYSIQKVSEEVAKKHRLKLYKKGTILFAKSGMSCLKGYVYVLPCDAYVVSHLACVTPNEDISEYLKYYFCYHKPNQLVKDAAYPSISLSDIGCLEIDLKDATHRNAVVDSLQKLSSIVEMRKQQLTELDTLVKARFVEMFGDPENNPKKWPVKKLAAVVSSITAGWSVNGEARPRNAGEKAVLKVSAVTQGFFRPDEYKVISADMEIKKYVYPQKGDLLFSRANTRELVGATAVIEQDYPELLLPDKLWKVLFTNEMDVYYAKHILSTQAIRKVFSSQSTGTSGSMFNVSTEKFRETMIPVPPLMLQHEFANFVQQTNKSKFIVQKALDEAQTLFDSLMQQYFG